MGRHRMVGHRKSQRGSIDAQIRSAYAEVLSAVTAAHQALFATHERRIERFIQTLLKQGGLRAQLQVS